MSYDCRGTLAPVVWSYPHRSLSNHFPTGNLLSRNGDEVHSKIELENGSVKKVMIVGAGAQGNVIAGVLEKSEEVGEVMLCDLDEGRAKEVAEYLGSSKIRTARLDASDLQELTDRMNAGDFDLIVNATLPEFNRQILQAALASKTDYLDMASNELLKSSTEETVQNEFLVEQLEYAKEFEAAGLRAFILMGADSGLVNVMAKEAADQLDEIDYIGIKDYGIVECDEPVGLWSLQMYLEDCADPGIYWEDGQYKYAPVFSGEEDYFFGEPLNVWGKVFYHTHEEPVTIPQFIGKPVKYCDFKMGEPGSEMWRFMIDGLRLMDTEPIDVKGVQVSPRDVFFKMLPPTLNPKKCVEMIRDGKIMSRLQLAVDVKGQRDGKKYHHKMWTESPNIVEACDKITGTNDVSWITSIPASIASLMLLRGQIQRTGVFPAEVLEKNEREIFFKGIREWDIKIHKQVSTEV
jgi:saccharopine dehydrogenase (NAD+, L-lysine-forming)